MADPKVPTTKAEADAARQALAKYDVGRIEAALDVLKGTKVKNALAALQELVDGGLPAGSATAANLPRLPGYFDQITKSAEADLETLFAVADPEAAAAKAAPSPVPLMPHPPAPPT